MSENIEQKCIDKGVKLTDQRRIIVKVLSESKKTYINRINQILFNFKFLT